MCGEHTRTDTRDRVRVCAHACSAHACSPGPALGARGREERVAQEPQVGHGELGGEHAWSRENTRVRGGVVWGSRGGHGKGGGSWTGSGGRDRKAGQEVRCV